MSDGDTNSNPPCDDTLQTLEKQIEYLVKKLSELRLENEALSHRQAEITKERTALYDQNHLARKKIESLIAKLKSMESGK